MIHGAENTANQRARFRTFVSKQLSSTRPAITWTLPSSPRGMTQGSHSPITAVGGRWDTHKEGSTYTRNLTRRHEGRDGEEDDGLDYKHAGEYGDKATHPGTTDGSAEIRDTFPAQLWRFNTRDRVLTVVSGAIAPLYYNLVQATAQMNPTAHGSTCPHCQSIHQTVRADSATWSLLVPGHTLSTTSPGRTIELGTPKFLFTEFRRYFNFHFKLASSSNAGTGNFRFNLFLDYDYDVGSTCLSVWQSRGWLFNGIYEPGPSGPGHTF
ncbi:hypothetical protein B0H17DRAFT_1269256 [Mycena rosella]|uniref:Uncharacterized protein n=1 Tax=Mycena rosella TaxID=1033263 RepID=A0AAD7CLW3_MYCRO|nr:hypothetical protein B0H17DRAFT_1269256 [Mycena rosella]